VWFIVKEGDVVATSLLVLCWIREEQHPYIQESCSGRVNLRGLQGGIGNPHCFACGLNLLWDGVGAVWTCCRCGVDAG